MSFSRAAAAVYQLILQEEESLQRADVQVSSGENVVEKHQGQEVRKPPDQAADKVCRCEVHLCVMSVCACVCSCDTHIDSERVNMQTDQPAVQLVL